MKTLIVEDDFASRMVLQGITGRYGEVHVAVNGKEAILAFNMAIEAKTPYDLICLDVMMPEMDGHTVLKEIRAIENAQVLKREKRVTIFMVTALADKETVVKAAGLCDAYIVKPVSNRVFVEHLNRLGLIKQ